MSAHASFYEQVATYERPVIRHERFLAAYRDHRATLGRPLDVLDVGCGEHAVLADGLAPEDRYFGVDVKEHIAANLDRYASLDLDRDELAEPWGDQRFDVIFCGEVIEHVFSPDRLLRQLASVSHDDTLIVLSTPNLAYWLNRLLLLVGINPMFVENSSDVVLGRRTAKLGQGNPTQGHIRLFTNRAMLDLLEREQFRVRGVSSVPVWGLPGEQVLCRWAPSLGPNTIYLLQPPASR
ncbi:MAG: methyltransferase domain-containing protein [Solirubrobacteraceae bacterium]|nr:methyltransferase domain-containing protein [Solirubrobacteraceae bacterium]